MKKLSVLSLGTLVLLVMTLPLMGQAPDFAHIYAHTPIQVTSVVPSNVPVGILPSQFRAAYGFNRIPNQGQGMTIALVDAYDDPNIASDLAFYANYFHLGPCNFTKVKLGSIQGQGWNLEEALDVEQACALAPAANIVLVEAATNSFDDLFAAVQVATQPPYNATTVSMSWGGGEFQGEQQADSYFCNILNGNGQPVTYFASTGDGGHGTIYPSTSVCVIGVGGTTLVLSTTTPPANTFLLDYGHEAAWRSGGGGLSPYESQPSYQNPACATWSTSARCVPDISSVASNIPVYETFSYGGWVTVQGTSISSPDWAAFFTLVNSLRANAGKSTLSQANYDLYQLYYSANYNTDFHDITTGNNGGCGSQCNAVTGYDLATGIGTYEADTLYRPLVAATN